jgi:hypothetical protein
MNIKDYLEGTGLSPKSTPCEICRMMNGIKHEETKKHFLGDTEIYSPRDPQCFMDETRCIDSDRASIKLQYLVLVRD